jgi:hypothetical protein
VLVIFDGGGVMEKFRVGIGCEDVDPVASAIANGQAWARRVDELQKEVDCLRLLLGRGSSEQVAPVQDPRPFEESVQAETIRKIKRWEYDSDGPLAKLLDAYYDVVGGSFDEDYRMVIDALRARAEVGKQRYGTYLFRDNGRDMRRDLLEELLDAMVYLVGTMEKESK